MIYKCKICDTQFYPRPSHVKMGWGIYCSRNCKNIGTRVRQKVFCFICNKKLMKTVTQLSIFVVNPVKQNGEILFLLALSTLTLQMVIAPIRVS